MDENMKMIQISSHKATICCMLVSHQYLSLQLMQSVGHYLYTIIHQLQKKKKFGS